MKNIKKYLIFYSLTLLTCVSANSSENIIQLIKQENPDLVYISDTGHTNQDLVSVYVDLVEKLAIEDKKFNCVFVEADRDIFQPAVDKFMFEDASWEETIGIAQADWERVTGRPYKQARLEFLAKMKTLNIRVEAVDWSDRSTVSESMKSLFKLGFSGDMHSLKLAFDLGVDSRNNVMAYNINKLMTPSATGPAKCSKALIFVGGLHLANRAKMPMGEMEYTSIAANPLLKEFKAFSSEIIDCRAQTKLYSNENRSQCNDKTAEGEYKVESLFSPIENLTVRSLRSYNREGSFLMEIFPAISYNIMIQ